MLQPQQLKDVSDRYAQEIAELRDFLTKADLHLGTAESLGNITTRLRDDRTFRRDLTSHVWVMIHSSNRQISYPDLLGILAIAAAGPRFAAAADETDAHDLLRFLMEARRSFDATSVAAAPKQPPVRWPNEPVVIPAAIPATQTLPPAESRPQAPLREYAQPHSAKLLSMEAVEEEEEEDNPDERKLIAWVSAACVLMVLLAVVWWHHESAVNRAAMSAPPAQGATATATPTLSAKADNEQLPAHSSETTTTALPPSSARRSPRGRHPKSTTHPYHFSPIQPTPENSESAFQTAPSNMSPESQPTSAPPPTTADNSASENPQPSQPQHNWRAATPAAPAKSNPSLIARTSPPATPPTRGGSTANIIHQAIVRPTSLGIMAANVMYSPAPAYPSAASAAHVQGEVKLEAEVGRDGSVVSTRVISGPPLLCDAAANALQQWRYRPYMYAGKPIATNATVVMDFQLN